MIVKNISGQTTFFGFGRAKLTTETRGGTIAPGGTLLVSDAKEAMAAALKYQKEGLIQILDAPGFSSVLQPVDVPASAIIVLNTIITANKLQIAGVGFEFLTSGSPASGYTGITFVASSSGRQAAAVALVAAINANTTLQGLGIVADLPIHVSSSLDYVVVKRSVAPSFAGSLNTPIETASATSTAGTPEVATVTAAGGATGPGVLPITVTGALVQGQTVAPDGAITPGTSLLVNLPVNGDATDNTATLLAAKIVAALNSLPQISTAYTVSNSSGAISITANESAPNDLTLSVSWPLAAGIAAESSSIGTAGVEGTGTILFYQDDGAVGTALRVSVRTITVLEVITAIPTGLNKISTFLVTDQHSGALEAMTGAIQAVGGTVVIDTTDSSVAVGDTIQVIAFGT
jgi:hypothetical protein